MSSPASAIRAAVTSVMVLALAVSGCATRTDGPLQLGGELGLTCAPAAPGQGVGFGEVVGLEPGEVATINSVELANPSNLTLTHAYILPMRDGASVGTMYLEDPPANWSDRQDAVGSEIEGAATNIVLVVTRERKEIASADNVVITYSVDGATFEARGTIAFQLADSCS